MFFELLSEENTADVDILKKTPEFSCMTDHHTKDSKSTLMECNLCSFPKSQGRVSWNGLITNGALVKLYICEKNI